MAVIRVPRPPKRAFNKNRRPNTLLRSQIEHLEWATRSKFGRKGAPRRGRKIRTEGEAAAYIGELTRRLHPEGAAPAGPAPGTERPRKEGVRKRPALKRR